MFIFYDFETSSRDVLGQILSYSFMVVDRSYAIQTQLNGLVRLNPMECPAIDAILTNKLSLRELDENGLFERDAAQQIFTFLSEQVQQYGSCALVGYNSNSFDLSFLRNLLIRHGFNPYFMGKLENVDLLHYVQHLAFENPDTFKWTAPSDEKHYFSFRLEDVCQAHGILSEAQTHRAEDDVLLTIDLVKFCTDTYQLSLSDFQAVRFPEDFKFPYELRFAKQKVRHFPEEGKDVEQFCYQYWLVLFVSKKSMCLLNLEKYKQAVADGGDNEAKLSCIRYINANKHFCVLEAFDSDEIGQWGSLKETVRSDTFFQPILTNPASYFDMIKKEWDIQYQIHELGFERIDGLKALIERLMAEPDSYHQMVRELMENRVSGKDTYLIQLFNRFYLNNHPDVPIDHAKRYLVPRYVTGALYRNPEDFATLPSEYARLEGLVKDGSLSDKDKGLCEELHGFYGAFLERYGLVAVEGVVG